MDNHQALRSLSFPVIGSILGIDTNGYRQSNGDWVGRCPVHNSKNNKGCFRYHHETGKFNCFSCGAKGRGPIDLAMAVKGLGFKAAVALLESAGPTISTIPIHPILAKEKSPVLGDSEALQPLAKDTWRKFAVACPWLEQRIPDAGVRELYGVFQYRNPARKSVYTDRIMIPIRSLEGELFGYLGRVIEGEPKYLWPKNLPKTRFLFGAFELKDRVPVRTVYLVESPWSVMKFCMLGLPALALYGWSVSDAQADLLAKLAKSCIFLPDKNKRPDVGPSLHLLTQRLWTRLPDYPGEDPEDLAFSEIQAL